MGPAGLLCLFVWTHTLFTPSVSSEVSVHQEFAPALASQPIRRPKRQYSTDEMIEEVIHRINDVEDDAIKSQKDVQEVLGYLKALDVSASNGHLPKLRDPCGNGNELEGSNETNWTRFGASKCVKLIEGLSNFTNAHDVCREEYRIGEDIARPLVVSLDSTQKAMDLLETLSLQGTLVTSVWINRANGSMCPELRVPDTNRTVESVDFKMVKCGRVNSVVCEKPVIASFVEIVEQQFGMNVETKKLKKQLKEAKDEIQHLREELSEEKRLKRESDRKADAKIQTIVEALRSEFNSKLSQLELRVKGVPKEGEVTRGDLTDVQTAVTSLGIWRRQTEAQMRTEKANLGGLVEEVNQIKSRKEASLEKLQVAVRKVGEWDLGGHRPFIIQKTVGVWYWIERFQRNVKSNLPHKCLEFEISLNGNNRIDYLERYKLGSSDEITIGNFTRTVNTQSPHYWTTSGTYNELWLKTDYDNWGILGGCKSNDISSCDFLHIYSRSRTLPSATLEMLRDAVEKFGFPKSNGGFVDQTSC